MAVKQVSMGSYHFEVDHDEDDIKRVWLLGGGVDLKPILDDEVLLHIFDSIFGK